MARPGERSEHRPAGIFDVRDHYREQQVADGLAATVPGPVRFAVTAVVTPAGRVEPRDWLLDTRRTLSGLSVFLDRVVAGPPDAGAPHPAPVDDQRGAPGLLARASRRAR